MAPRRSRLAGEDVARTWLELQLKRALDAGLVPAKAHPRRRGERDPDDDPEGGCFAVPADLRALGIPLDENLDQLLGRGVSVFPAVSSSENARPRRTISPMGMRLALIAAAAAAVLVASVAAGSRSSARAGQPSMYSPPRELVLYGHIRSLTRTGARYQLRFDPALWLSGTTANRAAAEDGAIPPGDMVPNDYYIRDETHRLLTYRVPSTAWATVITNAGSRGLRSTRVPVSELAQIVRGRNPRGRRLFVPGNRLGFWIRVRVDTVRSLNQQYQP